MDNIQHQTGGGGWISGPSITTSPAATGSEIEAGVRPYARDMRPQVNPTAFLRDIAEMLRQQGTPTDLADREYVATMRAADLLEAMGLRAAAAPERGRRGAR